MGDQRICVAVIDGPVDLTHPCFAGAALKRLESYWTDGKHLIPETVEHATFVMSLVLGQHGSMVEGCAPRCRGINIPTIYDPPSMLEPMALAHAINLAFREGANIIHVASCIPTKSGAIYDLVARAIRSCIDNNVLVVAPAGNDKGECFCVPAIVPGAIAVGAYDQDGRPASFSNFGGIYELQGVLAPGVDITGAASGGKTAVHKGTSCAAPVVTGVAALLMGIQLSEGWPLDSRLVREAILRSALPCTAPDAGEERRCLHGLLNVSGAVKQLFGLSRERQRSRARQYACSARDASGKSRSARWRRAR